MKAKLKEKATGGLGTSQLVETGRGMALGFAEKNDHIDDSGEQAIRDTDPLSMDNRAQVGMADKAVSIVVAIVVAGLLAAFLLPIAIEEISSVDTTSWDSDGAAALWDVLPVLIVLAIFLFFVTVAVSNRAR